MKKVISLLLISVFMLSVLVSCGQNRQFFYSSNETETPTAHLPEEIPSDSVTDFETETSPPHGDIISNFDFEGLELHILSRDTKRYAREWGKEEDDENYNIGYELVQRNEMIADSLSLDFKVETVSANGKWEDWSGMQTMWNAMNDGQGKYDIYSHSARGAAYGSIRGCTLNILNEEMFPNFDFSQPCWNQSMLGQAINGNLHYITGDINLSLFDHTVVMWHNKTLYDRYKTADDPQDMQDVALDGNFDYESFYRWSSLVEIYGKGATDCDNTYGISDLNQAFYDAIPYAWELEMIVTDYDGTHLMYVDGNDKVEIAIADLRALRAKTGVNNCQKHVGSSECDNGLLKHFANGQSMFMPNTFCASDGLISEEYRLGNDYIRDMEDKYCVLPMPKYYLDQQDYKTTAVTDFNVLSVANNGTAVSNGEAISAFLQETAEYTYNNIRSFYIESMVKPRWFGAFDDDYVTVSKSIDTVHKIFNNITFDTVNTYSTALSNIAWNMDYLVEETFDSFEKSLTSPTDIQGTPFLRAQAYQARLEEFDEYMFIYGNAKG